MPPDREKGAVPIKKEVQEFIIACEHLCRLFSKGEPLSCHEAEILNCCMDEFAKWRLVSMVRPQAQSKKGHREN
jgi:hypothetical protein